MIAFARPALFLLAAIPALLALWRGWRLRHGAESLDLPSLPPARPTLRTRLAVVPQVLFLLGLGATIAALAGPQRLHTRSVDAGSGVDIAVALDVSGSMAAEDFRPRNRLEVARSVVADFVRGRPNDLLALITFAGRAETLCPATDDRPTLLALLAPADGSRLPDGTAIGNAIATGVARLKDLPSKSKVIVLVTDGGNNAGQVDPETAANIAKAYGIRIHTIGVGRGGLVPITITVRDPATGQTTKKRIEAEVAVDDELLKRIAAATGGRFFHATDSQALASIFREIDSLEKTPLPARMEIVVDDLSGYPAAAAAALLAVWAILASGPLRIETEAA
jgi:Ca-activated chloride channel family protein